MTAWLLAFLLATQPGSDSASPADSSRTSIEASVSDSVEASKLLAVQSAWDGDSTSRRSEDRSPRSVGSTLIQIVSSLLLLLGLSVAGILLLRKVRRRETRRSGVGSLLDVLESRPLGQGNHVSLVRVHDRVIAVGHGQGSVSPLAEFVGADAAAILAESGNGVVTVKDFAATLDTFLERFRSNPRSADVEDGKGA